MCEFNEQLNLDPAWLLPCFVFVLFVDLAQL